MFNKHGCMYVCSTILYVLNEAEGPLHSRERVVLCIRNKTSCNSSNSICTSSFTRYVDFNM